jgi:hypothetical protein
MRSGLPASASRPAGVGRGPAAVGEGSYTPNVERMGVMTAMVSFLS